MTARSIAFFNSKGGVGATMLAYHLAWMMVNKGRTVLAADLDPQASLTARFLDNEALESLWAGEADTHHTVYGSLASLVRGSGDISPAPVVSVSDRLSLMPGDLALASCAEELSRQWRGCLDGTERSFRVVSVFWRLLADAAAEVDADVVLIDVGPNLGAISRAALLAADHVVIPMAPDLFGAEGLRSLGPALRAWRSEWQQCLQRNLSADLALPDGQMRPAGYVLHQGIRAGQTIQTYRRWVDRIPGVYRASVLGVAQDATHVADDPYCLRQIRHYPSLMPMAHDVRKPVFRLKPADGASGGFQAAVAGAWEDFSSLADRIADEVGLAAPIMVEGLS